MLRSKKIRSQYKCEGNRLFSFFQLELFQSLSFFFVSPFEELKK